MLYHLKIRTFDLFSSILSGAPEARLKAALPGQQPACWCGTINGSEEHNSVCYTQTISHSWTELTLCCIRLKQSISNMSAMKQGNLLGKISFLRI